MYPQKWCLKKKEHGGRFCVQNIILIRMVWVLLCWCCCCCKLYILRRFYLHSKYL